MKTGILLTVRLKSTRLRRKALLELGSQSILTHIIKRLSKTSLPIIVCTSYLKEDDSIEQVAKENGVRCFRGHPVDVIDRLYHSCLTYGLDHALCCTGDNPLVDPIELIQLLRRHQQYKCDYSSTSQMPLGTGGRCVRFDSLVKVNFLKKEKDTEIWGPLFTDSGVFYCREFTPSNKDLVAPELRFTVDTPEDYTLMKLIYEKLEKPNTGVDLKEAIELCLETQAILNINKDITQKQAPEFDLSNFNETLP